MKSTRLSGIWQTISLVFHISPWDILTGLPAGMLIVMGTVLFTTLLGQRSNLPNLVPLIIFVIMSFLVGILSGITRLTQGPATALSAGLITAGILVYLWSVVRPGDQFNHLVIGPIGIFIAIIICPIGGFLGAKVRKVL